jgi:hypothetical protein
MKRLQLILVLAIVSTLLLAQLYQRIIQPGPETETMKTPEAAPSEPPLPAAGTLPDYAHIPDRQPPGFYDRITALIDPESLRQYEGTYTLDELLSGNGQAPAFSLNSSWFIGSSNLPQAGILLRKNPDSGQYEFSGGDLYLPGSGVGVRYEEDEQSGETRTFINVKKKF